jgi:hypothetical protein
MSKIKIYILIVFVFIIFAFGCSKKSKQVSTHETVNTFDTKHLLIGNYINVFNRQDFIYPEFNRYTYFSIFYDDFLEKNSSALKIKKFNNELNIDFNKLPVSEKELYQAIRKISSSYSLVRPQDIFKINEAEDLYKFGWIYALISFYTFSGDFADYEISAAYSAAALTLLKANVPENNNAIELLESIILYLSGEVNKSIDNLKNASNVLQPYPADFINFITCKSNGITETNKFSILLKAISKHKDRRRVEARNLYNMYIQLSVDDNESISNSKPISICNYFDWFESNIGAHSFLYPVIQYLSMQILGEKVDVNVSTHHLDRYVLDSVYRIKNPDNIRKYLQKDMTEKVRELFLPSVPVDELLSPFDLLFKKYFEFACYQKFRLFNIIYGLPVETQEYLSLLQRTDVLNICNLMEGLIRNAKDIKEKFATFFEKDKSVFYSKIFVAYIKYWEVEYYAKYYQDNFYASSWQNALAGFFSKKSNWNKSAITNYEEAKEYNRYMQEAYYELSFLHSDTAIIEEALELMNESYNMKYLAAEFYSRFATSYYLPEIDVSIALYEELLNDTDDTGIIIKILKDIYKNSGNVNKSIALIETHYLEKRNYNVRDINTLTDLAYFYLFIENEDTKAFNLLKEIEYFGTGGVMGALARYYESQGDTESAEEYYLKYKNRYGRIYGTFHLVKFYLNNENYPAAVNELDNFGNWNDFKNRSDLFYASMFSLRQMMYPSVVIWFYENYFSNYDDYTSVYDYLNLAISYFCTDRLNDAEKILRLSMEKNKANSFTYYILLAIQLKRNNISDGFELLNRVENRDYHPYLKKVILENIDLETAKKEFQGTVNSSTYLSTFYGLMGYVLKYNGNDELAEKYFKYSGSSIRHSRWIFSIISSYESGLKKSF